MRTKADVVADCKRVAEQTGILTKEPDHPPQEC
jgi:hypothetical protein